MILVTRSASGKPGGTGRSLAVPAEKPRKHHRLRNCTGWETPDHARDAFTLDREAFRGPHSGSSQVLVETTSDALTAQGLPQVWKQLPNGSGGTDGVSWSPCEVVWCDPENEPGASQVVPVKTASRLE